MKLFILIIVCLVLVGAQAQAASTSVNSYKSEVVIKPPVGRTLLEARPDILDSLAARWRYRQNNRLSDFQFSRGNLNADGFPIGEMHVAFLPTILTPQPFPNSETDNLPINNTLIRLIDSVPREGVIRVAIYMFTHQPLKDALVRALRRGTKVLVVTSDAFRISDTSQDNEVDSTYSEAVERLALAVRRDLEAAMLATNDGLNRFVVCENKSSPSYHGGCLGNHLMHHKFVTLSTVCRFGLAANGHCLAPNDSVEARSFKKVVFQSSENYVYGSKHEVASAFMGREDLYVTYRRQFNRLMMTAFEGPVLNANMQYVHPMAAASNLTVNFMPRPRDENNYRQTDIFLRDLEGLVCVAGGKKTEIRVANTHWNGDVAKKVVQRLGELRRAGCVVKVLLPRDMAATASSSVSAGDALIYRNLVSTGAEVRTFASAPGNRLASMHSKYVIVNRAVGKPQLMFGTMSFTKTSQTQNDESWLVWENPSEVAERFYRENFDRLFSQLPQPAICGELDGKRGLLPGLVGYWKLNGDEQKNITEGQPIASVVGPVGMARTFANLSHWTAGALQQGMSFDGYQSYVTLPYDENLSPVNALTLSVWVKSAGSTGKVQNIISKAQEGGYQLSIVGDKLEFLLNLDKKYHKVSGFMGDLADQQWHHVSATYNGSLMQLYVDGSMVGEREAQGKISYKFQNRLCFGRGSHEKNCAGDGFFRGALDEIAVFNRAFSANDVQSMVDRRACVGPAAR